MFCVLPDVLPLTETTCDDPTAWLVMTRTELLMHSPFYLDIESAVRLSGALLLGMAVAFVIRMLRKSLEQHDEVN